MSTLDDDPVAQPGSPTQRRKRHSWTPEQKMEACGLAAAIGVRKAGRKLGIPHRNISSWLRKPEFRAVIEQSHEAVVDKLWEAVTVGTDEVLKGFTDPKATLQQKATALRVVTESYQLLSGGATERSESTAVTVQAQPVLEAGEQQLLEAYLSWAQRQPAPKNVTAEVESDVG